MTDKMPPVKSTLTGIRATFREGQDVLTVQNSVSDKLLFTINREKFSVDTNQFLGALNTILGHEHNTKLKGEKE